MYNFQILQSEYETSFTLPLLKKWNEIPEFHASLLF